MMDTGEWYRRFAQTEAAGTSPVYERLCMAVAASSPLLDRLDRLPRSKRQPNLLLAAGRYLDGPLDDDFVGWVLDRWDDVAGVVTSRATQTNEAARSAAFLPFLSALPGALTLIEVGASAGLCLYPDRYAISYDGQPALATSPVRIDVRTDGGIDVPTRLPTIVERIGIDLNPLDVTNADDLAWLRACIWPEHDRRRDRLEAAATVVAAEPPRLIPGDLLSEIDAVLDGAAAATTPVVFHSATLLYVDRETRRAFAARLADRPDTVWLSNEPPGVVDGLVHNLQPPAFARTVSHFVVGSGGVSAVALSDPHGSWLSGR